MPSMRRAFIYPPIVALGVSPVIAFAQAKKTEVPTVSTGWRVDCNNNGKTLDCRAFSDIIQRETNKIISSVSVRYDAAAKKPVMIVQLPLGILVTEGVSVTLDNDR